jgi:type IV pilus assembly protein PilW
LHVFSDEFMKKKIAYSQNQRQRGRTLLELMISIAIGLVVIGAVSVVYLTTAATSRQSLATSRASEDAAIIMNILGSNLRMAGYSPPRTLVSIGSAIVGGDKISIPDQNLTAYAIRGCDFGFSSAYNVAFENITCNTDVGPAAFAVRYEGDEFNTFAVNKTSALPNGQPSDCVSVGIDTDTESSYDSSRVYKLVEARFSIATSASNGTLELYCGGSGGTGTARFKRQPLMQFVENMVISYGISDNNSGGNVVRYVTQTQLDALAGSIASNWSRVVNVKLCIVMLNEKSKQENGGNYIDCTGNSVASPGGYVRRAFTSVFTLRNRANFSDV